MNVEKMLREFVVVFADDWETRKKAAKNVKNLDFTYRADEKDQFTCAKFYEKLLDMGQYNKANGDKIILFLTRSEFHKEKDFWQDAIELGLFTFDPHSIQHLFSDGIIIYVEL